MEPFNIAGFRAWRRLNRRMERVPVGVQTENPIDRADPKLASSSPDILSIAISSEALTCTT